MNLQEYTEFTNTTAIYPEANTKSPVEAMYLLLGFMSEQQEYTEIFSAFAFDYNVSSIEVIKELGDCLWYLTRLEAIFGSTASAEESYTFDIAGAIKKYFRDGVIHRDIPKWINTQWEEITSDLELLNNTSCEIYSLEEVLDINVEKLTSRKNRGTLTGNGDNR